MKPAASCHPLRLLPVVFLAVSIPAFSQATAPEPQASASNTQESAYRNSIAEEAVRKETDKIHTEITQLVAELKLNGLGGDDVANLSNASDHLQNLSQQDMQRVINALQSASMNSQEQGRQQSLVNAYKAQQEVMLKLKSLAVELALRESQKEISSKLEDLIARQSANIRQTSTLPADVTSADQLNAQQKTTHDVAASEQTSIGGEIDLLFKILAAKPEATPADGAPAASAPDVSKSILESLTSSLMKDASTAAIQFTDAGPFPTAVAKQTSVRDYLIAALRVSLSNDDPVARLQEAKDSVNQIINDQKDLADAAKQSTLDGSTLAERQAKIDDRASVAQALLKPVSAVAADQIKEAQKAMAQSSNALAQAKSPTDTAPKQQAVIDALQKTQALLDKQIAAAQQEQNISPVDKLAQLQQLQNEINQEQKDPQPSANALQKLQQDAVAPSPQAANQIAAAADEAQKPQPDQAAVQQALAQANDAVQQQAAALKQAAQDYQALNQASQQLQKAQQDAAAAAQAMQNNTPNALTQAAHDLTQAQAAVDQTKQNTPPAGVPTAAQQAMQQASDALKNAAMQAVQAQPAAAQAQDQKAMAAMQQARTDLAQAMAQVQQQSEGQSTGQPQPGQQKNESPQAVAADAPANESRVLQGIGPDGGPAQVIGGLKPKDRDAIAQYQAEKSPPEYAPLVQQYLKNLADSSGTH